MEESYGHIVNYCKELDEGDIEILEAMIPSVREFFPLHLPLHLQSSNYPADAADTN